MSNKSMGEIKATVDDKTWVLVCDFNALCDFEDETGQIATDVMQQLQEGSSVPMKQVRAFVWACMCQRHPEATLQDAGRLISAEGDVLARAIEAAFPAAEGGDDAESGGAPLGEAKAQE